MASKPIEFEATLYEPTANNKFGQGLLLSLPKDVSAKMPSRGMVMVQGTLCGRSFYAALEPDGNGSHWFRVDKVLGSAAGLSAGDTVVLSIEPMKEWPEPKVPEDWEAALEGDAQAHAAWTDITPAARWDWIRWIEATLNPETRQRRIEVGCSKLRSGKRRPCCFDRSQSTLTDA